MTDLDRIRGELKRIPSYDPKKPLQRDLLEQVANDLALEWGTDSSYVLELFEQIAKDTDAEQAPGKVTAERILRSLFDVLAPHYSGNATRPNAIEYVAIKFPDNTVDMTRRDQILEAALQECGWPIGTIATIQGQRFELTYAPRGNGRSAYVLWQPGGNFLIPRYNEALSRHIEKRDQAFGVEPDEEEDDDNPFRALGRGFNSRCVLPNFATKPISKKIAFPVMPPRYGKRLTTMIVDDVAERSTPSDQADALAWWYSQIPEALKRIGPATRVFFGIDFAAEPKKEPERDLGLVAWLALFLEPPAAPTSPVGLPRLPGHPRNPERRSRAPPGARTLTIGTMAQPAGFGTRGLRRFRVPRSAMRLEDIRKALVDNGFAPKSKPSGAICPVPGCNQAAIVPDDKVLFCSDHHYKCNTKIEGGECSNRVRELGAVCRSCSQAGKHARVKPRGGRGRR